MPETTTDEAAAILARCRASIDAATPVPMTAAGRLVVSVFAPRLLAAVEIALSQHRRSREPAWGQGSLNLHGHHYCAGACYSSVDDLTLSQRWPCKPYQDIARALLEEAATP